MSVYPVTQEPVILTGNYPHMARRDAPLWESYIKTHGAIFTGVAYDVALGGVVPEGVDEEDETVIGWRYSTAVKLDAVLFTPEEVWIVEVKPNASLSAIGQVLGYMLLAEREPFTDLPLIPTIITDHLNRDVQYVAEQLNVQIIVVDTEGEET